MSYLVQDPAGNNLTYKIIGAAMNVHNNLGPGYKEEVYGRALLAELRKQDITAESQYQVEIYHEGVAVGLFFLDLLVEDTVVVELKAFSHLLTKDETAQVLNYLKATGKPVALLFNFGRRQLEYHRIFPSSKFGPVERIGRDNVRKRIIDPTGRDLGSNDE